jgi:hypothetical protein
MYMCVPTGVLLCTLSLSLSLSLSLPIVRVLGHSVLTAMQTLGVSAAGVALVALTALHTAYAVSVIVQRADSAAGVFQKDEPIHTYTRRIAFGSLRRVEWGKK